MEGPRPKASRLAPGLDRPGARLGVGDEVSLPRRRKPTALRLDHRLLAHSRAVQRAWLRSDLRGRNRGLRGRHVRARPRPRRRKPARRPPHASRGGTRPMGGRLGRRLRENRADGGRHGGAGVFNRPLRGRELCGSPPVWLSRRRRRKILPHSLPVRARLRGGSRPVGSDGRGRQSSGNRSAGVGHVLLPRARGNRRTAPARDLAHTHGLAG